MRVVKEAQERKNEILDAANVLFTEKGFDGTSTTDILEMVGIARGTLYYHFKSKEDIMDALIERTSIHILKKAESIASDKSIPVSERIIRSIMALNVTNNSSDKMLEHMHKPQNALMHQKTQNIIISGITPILSDIIHEGIAQGVYHTPFPYECMEMIMIYSNTVFDEMFQMSDEERASRIPALIFNMERLLGTESGELSCVMQIFDGRG